MAIVRPTNGVQTLQSGADPRAALMAMARAQTSFDTAGEGIADAFVNNPLQRELQAFNQVKKADELTMRQGLEQAKAGGSQTQLDWLNGGADALMGTLQNVQGIDRNAEFASRDNLRQGMQGVLKNEEAIKAGPKTVDQRENLLFAENYINNEKQVIEQAVSAQIREGQESLSENYGKDKVIKFNPVLASYGAKEGEDTAQELSRYLETDDSDSGGEKPTAKSAVYKELLRGYEAAGGKGTITAAHLAHALNPEIDDPFFGQFFGNRYYENKPENAKTMGEYFAAQERLAKKAASLEQSVLAGRDTQFKTLDDQLKEFSTKQGENTLKRYYGGDIQPAVFKSALELQKRQAKLAEGKLTEAARKKAEEAQKKQGREALNNAKTEPERAVIRDAIKGEQPYNDREPESSNNTGALAEAEGSREFPINNPVTQSKPVIDQYDFTNTQDNLRGSGAPVPQNIDLTSMVDWFKSKLPSEQVKTKVMESGSVKSLDRFEKAKWDALPKAERLRILESIESTDPGSYVNNQEAIKKLKDSLKSKA